MSERVLNESVIDELLTLCENAAERELVGKMREVGYPVNDFLVSTIRMAAAAGGKEMFVASGGSTFTVRAVDEDDYTVWQDMTFDDVTIVEEP